MTCCFTGHRSIPACSVDKLQKSLDKALDNLVCEGVTNFICGGALGFDTLAAQAVLRLKQKNKDVFLTLALPCRDQAKRWNSMQRLVYEDILASADEVIYLFDHYVTGCMHARDKFMVDSSDIIIAYYRGKSGGTQYTFKYAEEQKKKIILL
jgi:uncharacterized phage-like protein YoqJ